MTKNTNTTPPEVSAGWRLAALIFWWIVLLGSVTVSSYGNVLHAELVANSEFMRDAKWILGALAWTLLIMVEGIAIADRGGSRGKARTAALCVLLPILSIVLVASYAGLYHLIVALGVFVPPADAGWFSIALLNYGLAAVPDLLMIVATLYVMSFRAVSPAVKSAAKSPARSALGKIGGNYMQRWVESSEGKKPEVTAESTSRRQANDIVPPTPEPVFDTREATPVRVANTKSVTPAPTPSRVADAETPNVEVAVFDADILQFAAEVAERAKVRQPVETVARVIEALEETGGNLSHAAGRVGLSRDPARRIRAALAEINGNQEPELVAV